jgi:phosphate transport system substrate-binding protein
LSRRRLTALALLLLSLAACGEPVLTTPEPVFLQASGSTTLAPLVAELAAAYTERDPLVTVEVSGLGTSYGLDALRRGEADIALASWLPADLPASWLVTPIARDGIAIIVHPDNPLDGLGLLQLQDLFGGRAYEWAAAGGRVAQGSVQPVSREEGSGTRAAFEALVMGDQLVTPLAVVAPSPQAVVEYVAGHTHALGYVSMSQVTPDVKVLKIEGELPTPETAGRGSYPISHELWLVTANPPPEAVQRFLDSVRGPAGQQIVGQRYGRIK